MPGRPAALRRSHRPRREYRPVGEGAGITLSGKRKDRSQWITKQQLLARLDAIGAALKASGEALALLALGSVGVETDRIDAYSDLDFFAIVKPNRKQRFMDNLDWLAAPIAYSFRNTEEVTRCFTKMAFSRNSPSSSRANSHAIPFAPGRIVWKADEFDASLTAPRVRSPYKYALDWVLGEALTNLYVGMGRERRGETAGGAAADSGSRRQSGHAPRPVHRSRITPTSAIPSLTSAASSSASPASPNNCPRSCRATTATPPPQRRFSLSSKRISRSTLPSKRASSNCVTRHKDYQ